MFSELSLSASQFHVWSVFQSLKYKFLLCTYYDHDYQNRWPCKVRRSCEALMQSPFSDKGSSLRHCWSRLFRHPSSHSITLLEVLLSDNSFQLSKCHLAKTKVSVSWDLLLIKGTPGLNGLCFDLQTNFCRWPWKKSAPYTNARITTRL